LLVVIAIIALLLSILLPALQQAKEMARMAVCATSQRNFAMGIYNYAHENNGAWLTSACNKIGYDVRNGYFNGSSKLGNGYGFDVRFALFLGGRDVNDTLWSGSMNDPDGFMNEGTWQEEWWEWVADTAIFWCPDAPGPETVTDPFGFDTVKDGLAQENGIVGTSIVPNARFSPVSNYPLPPVTKRMDILKGPPAETLVCGDGNEIGMKTFSGQFRQGYTGEYSDPIWRHLSTTPTPENRDQGWWATPYGDGPPADLQPRGNGRANFGFLDGHVTSMTEPEIRDRWESGLINYSLR